MTTYSTVNKNTTTFSTITKSLAVDNILAEVSSFLAREDGGDLLRESSVPTVTTYSTVNKNSPSYSTVTKN